MQTIFRYMEADYLKKAGTEGTYIFMGAGYTALDESPGAEMDEKTYIHNKTSSSTVKGYKRKFPFTAEMIKDEATIMDLWSVARDSKTGVDAERDYVKADLYSPVESKANTYKARKFKVSVEISDKKGDGGEILELTGNLNAVGDPVLGEFNTSTLTFTADSELTPA
ncbi:hypothetical protein [Terrisporobacter glycolicus]|uniref:Phage major tail protein, TP901-1 family n=1 Tax=Terrisporobacter glycolicus ATCC 14880 = DSM 1288 TaxID=1121315 RepID=A0ABZ2EW11_9FIRM|nr:hypothetical protein [Terrisporobacter glycolicus]